METDFQNQLRNISTHETTRMKQTTYQNAFENDHMICPHDVKIKKMSCLVAELYK